MKHHRPTTILPLLLALLSLTLTQHAVSAASAIERSISIMNESLRRIQVHWIHPDTGEMVLQSTPDILNGASQNLNSYVGHTFEVREMAAKKSGVCAGENEECRVDYFTVNSNEDQGESEINLIIWNHY